LHRGQIGHQFRTLQKTFNGCHLTPDLVSPTRRIVGAGLRGQCWPAGRQDLGFTTPIFASTRGAVLPICD
jgi:hypothetical protein